MADTPSAFEGRRVLKDVGKRPDRSDAARNARITVRSFLSKPFDTAGQPSLGSSLVRRGAFLWEASA